MRVVENKPWHKYLITYTRKIEGEKTLRCSEAGLKLVANSNFFRGQWLEVRTLIKKIEKEHRTPKRFTDKQIEVMEKEYGM